MRLRTPLGAALGALSILVLCSACGEQNDELIVVGTVERTVVELASPVSEVIVEVTARRGQHVAAGTVLVRLDPTLAEAEVARGEAALASARTSDRVALRKLERLKELRSGRVASEQALELVELERDEAAARLRERARATALTQTSLLVTPENGRLPALTAAETARVEAHRAAGGRPVRTRATGVGADGPEDRGLAERCLIGFSTGPPMLPGGYNNNVQIFQAPGYVALAIEMVHDFRIIPVGDHAPLPDGLRQWLGSSRGRWEGDTLVVETTHFSERVGAFSTTFESWGTGTQVRLVERFTRLDDDTLQYEFTVDDPTVFTESFSGRFPMSRSDLPIYEYACHEGNYGLGNILTGARAEESTNEENDEDGGA